MRRWRLCVYVCACVHVPLTCYSCGRSSFFHLFVRLLGNLKRDHVSTTSCSLFRSSSSAIPFARPHRIHSCSVDRIVSTAARFCLSTASFAIATVTTCDSPRRWTRWQRRQRFPNARICVLPNASIIFDEHSRRRRRPLLSLSISRCSIQFIGHENARDCRFLQRFGVSSLNYTARKNVCSLPNNFIPDRF
jgi:hypothetical protein